MKSRRDGFTLLEVLLAAGVFAMAILAIVKSRTISLHNMVDSERLAIVVQLAQEKMTEAQFKYQALINRDGIESAYGKEEGVFEAPYQEFKWLIELKEAKVQFSFEQITKFLMGLGVEKEDAEAQMEQQKLVLTNLNKMFKENFAELRMTIEWDQFNRKMKFPLVTHLIPEKPKITLTMETEDASSGTTTPSPPSQ